MAIEARRGAVPAAAPARPATAAVTHGSVRRRLLGTLGALFLAAMVVLSVAAQAWGRRAADQSFDRLLTASVLAMGDAVGFDGAQWDLDLPYAALDLLAMAPDDRVFYSLRTPAGALVTGYDDLPAPPAAQRREAERRAADGPAAQDATPVFFDAPYRGETVRFALAGRWAAGAADQGRAWLQVGQTRRARDAAATDTARVATAAIALLTATALLLCWWGVRRALAPVARLEHEIAGRAASDLQPIATPVPAEMAQAVGALNRFMGRLADNLDALRVFIADAAHQMRTPLAALRAQAQMAVDEPDAAEQRRSLVAIERNAERLTRLLNQLLSDATVAHRDTLRRFEPVDLLRTVREALRDAVPRADPQPVVRLHCDLQAAPMRGDALMLREAIKNLLDNALKHGVQRGAAGRADVGEGGSVGEAAAVEAMSAATPRTAEAVDLHDGASALVAEIDVTLAPAPGGGWALSVADRGPGIAADEMPTLFERFARGRDAGPGGAGLGMAIVHRVVERHGGRLALEPREGGGLVVRMQLPAAGGEGA
ncbi:sensor histidine kinase [Xylophilus sp. Leaf220]|uniref:sensor histidine kinase n=1 Tax=Xylophilus sp. Leaf220 TaxID=1735686 RepID=UPI0012E2971B|nr:sensor histidine kinase [Xylophilus sp. Leaf220]